MSRRTTRRFHSAQEAAFGLAIIVSMKGQLDFVCVMISQ